jgi:hypothetical protein
VTPLFLLFAAILLMAQLAVPRRWAFAPLLIAVSSLPNLTIIEIGAALNINRLLILVGLLRAIRERVSIWSPQEPLDRLIVVWAAWAVLSSFGHSMTQAYNPVTVSLALACDYLGSYLYARAYLRDEADFTAFSKCLTVAIIILSIFMLIEKVTGRNPYGALGAIADTTVRDGKIRATGPFGGSILAGTFAGVSLPLVVLILKRHFLLGAIGATACVVIVISSASSGPVMSLFAGLVALALWRWRNEMRRIKVGIVLAILGLALVMNAPVWYLIARIDFTGSSTSFHRAELINQGFAHLSEWWLLGTDYTRHWLPYGIEWSADHADMTNHYLKMGVVGGLPLMLLFIGILLKSFQLLGRQIRAVRSVGNPAEFGLWCLGATLFAHCASFIGVSYFDQNIVCLCLAIGAVPGLCAPPIHQPADVASISTGDNALPSPPSRPQPISVAGL